MYQPGLHIIATLATQNNKLIQQFGAFQSKIHDLIAFHQLTNLGEVFHQFEPNGYTAVVCLSESHISIHTWPEYEKVNLDIYLSNYKQVNNGIVETLFNELVSFFDASIVHRENIIR